jgi:alpha-1,3-rhamnosyl/mannosyltransferase
VPSAYTAGEVSRLLGVPPERVAVCPPGVPEWEPSPRGFVRDGYLLFMGTLEPRKNIAGLLGAYRRLVERWPDAPPLVLAGKATDDANHLLEAIRQPPLAGRVTQLGYVPDADRQKVYAGARALVLPSLEEGFGLPALEAMSLGIAVVAARRGALPEVVGDAGVLVDPTDESGFAEALQRVLADDGLARALAARGETRASSFSWQRTAATVRTAFAAAIHRRRARR